MAEIDEWWENLISEMQRGRSIQVSLQFLKITAFSCFSATAPKNRLVQGEEDSCDEVKLKAV